MSLRLPFAKGHGTHNDFLIIPDLGNSWRPTPDEVTWLCDRRRGLGADGVLRLVRTSAFDQADEVGTAAFFMDYRNSDGSIAEMCGNGVRVFARYLWDSGLESEPDIVVGTRSGPITLHRHGEDITAVLEGPVRDLGTVITVSVGARSWSARGVAAPNPHAVILDVPLEELDNLSYTLDPASSFPEGVNVEWVERRGPAHIAMRVHERGVGETMSCGTGACAAAWVAREAWGPQTGSWRVDVPGGSLHVDFRDDAVLLTGPAVIVAEGHVTLP